MTTAVASDLASITSFLVQIGAFIGAILMSQFCLKTRSAIGLVAIAGPVIAIAASVLADEQAAFLLLLFATVIYFFAVMGRVVLR